LIVSSFTENPKKTDFTKKIDAQKDNYKKYVLTDKYLLQWSVFTEPPKRGIDLGYVKCRWLMTEDETFFGFKFIKKYQEVSFWTAKEHIY